MFFLARMLTLKANEFRTQFICETGCSVIAESKMVASRQLLISNIGKGPFLITVDN